MIVEMTRGDISLFPKKKSLSEFYEAVCRTAGLPVYFFCSYDCTKIWIAPNIRDIWDDYAKRHSGEEGILDPLSMSMLICMSGTKEDPELPDNCVRIEEGFVTEEGSEYRFSEAFPGIKLMSAPWYTESWSDEDLLIEMKALDIPCTQENLERAREAARYALNRQKRQLKTHIQDTVKAVFSE
uniref:hypothetical protein n=1 Tax=Lachnoclostridium phocaeense TaxID=1871021 RepID=UPI0026DA72C5|nr:hypothetical protein [Lachnoclostridium phocaeense]